MQLFPHLLAPLLWERPGSIPPLVRLLQAYISKGSKQIEPERLVSLENLSVCQYVSQSCFIFWSRLIKLFTKWEYLRAVQFEAFADDILNLV